MGMRVELAGLRAPDFDAPTGTVEQVILHGHYAFELRATAPNAFRVVREQCTIHGAAKVFWYDRQGDVIKSNVDFLENIGRHWLSPATLLLQTIGGMYPFFALRDALSSIGVYSIEPSKLRNLQEVDIQTRLKADGSNAAYVLKQLSIDAPRSALRVSELLGAITSGVTQVRHQRQGKYSTMRFSMFGGEQAFSASEMSDGTLRSLGLLLAVFQTNQPRVLIIEEPEAGVHPGALGPLIDAFREASKHSQVIITTHSPDLADADWFVPNSFRVFTLESGVTRVSRLSELSASALRNHLSGAGELLRANALVGAPPILFDPDDAGQVNLFGDANDATHSHS